VTDPFGGLLVSFQLALEAEGKYPKTLDNYSRAVVQFADWLAANDRVDDVEAVTAADMRGWLVSLQARSRRPPSTATTPGVGSSSPGVSARTSWTPRPS
jgi:site-specific recombinase XerD